MTEIIDFGLFPSCVLNYNTLMFCWEICFWSSGLLLPKQISLHGDYFQCNSLGLISDGYSNWDISHSLYARNNHWSKTEEPTDMAMLPYQHAASYKISGLLSMCDMKTHQLPVKKTTQGRIGVKTRCKEHMRHLFLGQEGNLAVAELIMSTGQQEIQHHLQNG